MSILHHDGTRDRQAVMDRSGSWRVVSEPSASAVGRSAWDELAADTSLYCSYAWVSWTEQSPNHRASHFLLKDSRDTPVAILPAFVWDGSGHSPNQWYDPHHVFIAPHRPGEPRQAAWSPLLLLGSCAGYHSEVLVDARLPEGDRRAAVQTLLLAAADHAAQLRAARAMMYVPLSMNQLLSQSGTAALHCPATSAEAVIPVGADGLDGVLARLGSRRRREIRREIRQFQSAGHEIRTFTLKESWETAGRLLGELQRKYGELDTDAEMLDYLESQSRFLDENSRVLIEYDREIPVGFCLSYRHRDTLYQRAAGFSVHAAPFAYFNLVIYQAIEEAHRLGLKEVNLGSGSYAAKLARGARLRPQWSHIWAPPTLREPELALLHLPGPDAVEIQYLGHGHCYR